MRITGITALAATALLLSACGSATVDNTEETAADVTSVAPLERGSGVEDTETESEAESTDEQERPDAEPTSPQAQDRGAREIDEVPEQVPVTSDEDQGYLDALREDGVNVDGVEDQLIGAAGAACSLEDNVTIPAVAGQLIEQNRTDMDHAELVGLIENQARSAYC